eukprot:COSAG06_NODE_53627_length_295_cov_0.700000_1_plen_80_part_01
MLLLGSLHPHLLSTCSRRRASSVISRCATATLEMACVYLCSYYIYARVLICITLSQVLDAPPKPEPEPMPEPPKLSKPET